MSERDAELERQRRWRLVLGQDDEALPIALDERDRRIDAALSALYEGGRRSGRKGGLGGSAPRVARWLGDIREFFPTPVVQLIQQDAMERLGLRQMLLQPELLAIMHADVHLVADLMALRAALPERTRETARMVVATVVADLLQRLEQRTLATLRGAIDRSRRSSRPRFADVDWHRTLRRNLQHYHPAHGTVVVERLVGSARQSRARADLDQVILCVDQSGSMATSVVYASIFAAVMASIPALATRLVCFDTQVLDLTDQLQDPIEVLFGVQLGGGTDIHQAIAYVSGLVRQPTRTHLVLITDLFEGGDAEALLARMAELVAAGVRPIVLLALSDDGMPAYNADLAARFAALSMPVFACTPDLFPEMMAAALQGADLTAWAAARDIALVRRA